ncbi:MAG: PqiC family protein [Caldimonas sp.]
MPPHTHPFRSRFIGVLAAVALVACGSVPQVHLHTLMPVDPPARVASAPEVPAIYLEQVRLPAQVDQPQWLVRLADGSLVALEQERWASPLRDEFRQALLEQLVRRHGALDARGAGPAPSVYVRIAVDVRRLESLLGREARIEGSWALVPNQGRATPLRCDFLISVPVGAGMDALADGHRHAVTRLADAIAANLPRVGRGAPADCTDAGRR